MHSTLYQRDLSVASSELLACICYLYFKTFVVKKFIPALAMKSILKTFEVQNLKRLEKNRRSYNPITDSDKRLGRTNAIYSGKQLKCKKYICIVINVN